MSPAEDVVTTRRLTKRYGNDALAVADLDLSVRRGEVYLIEGGGQCCLSSASPGEHPVG
jgi:ABC-type Fe3+/spermidine/putrescine transport system ATPase subunit